MTTAITGAEAAIAVAGRGHVRITRGRDCYHPETRTVFLSEASYHGWDPASIYRALHEAAHARQHLERPLWFSLRNVRLFRLAIERDAWNRADVWMRRLGFDPGKTGEERKRGLSSYEGIGFRGNDY